MVHTTTRALSMLVAVAAIFSCAWTKAVTAGSLNISPITMTLSSASPIGIMMVENRGTRDTIIELQPQAWSQTNGENTLIPTTDIIATPAVFGLKAGERRPIRIGFLSAPKNSDRHEVSYRLEITETPPHTKNQAIQLRMQFSVPVFYAQNTKAPARIEAKPEIDFNITRNATANTLVLTAHNNGNRHARIVGLKLAESGENIPLQHGMASYVLPQGMVEQRISIPTNLASNTSALSKDATTAILLYADPGFPGIREQKIVIGYEALHVSRD